MRISPQIEFSRADGSPGRLFCGASATIAAAEGGIMTALAEARLAGATSVRISLLDYDTGRCVYRVRLRERAA